MSFEPRAAQIAQPAPAERLVPIESKSASGASNSLSNEAFADPGAFLRVLQQDFPKIDTEENGYLTVPELKAYAKNGSDLQGRLAASIAATHYNDLSSTWVPNINTSVTDPGYLTPFRLGCESDYYNKSSGGLIAEDEAESVGATLGAGLGTVALGALMILGMQDTPIAIGLAPFVMIAGVTAAYSAYDVYEEPILIQHSAASTRKLLASMPEINGGS